MVQATFDPVITSDISQRCIESISKYNAIDLYKYLHEFSTQIPERFKDKVFSFFRDTLHLYLTRTRKDPMCTPWAVLLIALGKAYPAHKELVKSHVKNPQVASWLVEFIAVVPPPLQVRDPSR